MGEKRVIQLVEAELLSDPGDIYTLSTAPLVTLERFGDLSVDNLLAAVEASKTRPLSRLLVGLGIRHLGPTGSRALARAYGSLDALMAAELPELAAVEGIGPVIADSVVEFLAAPANHHVIDKLRAAACRTGRARRGPARRGLRSLGRHDGYRGRGRCPANPPGPVGRGDRDHRPLHPGGGRGGHRGPGGKSPGSVSARTWAVVVGSEPGTAKLKKAEQLDIPVVDGARFQELIDSGELPA